MLKPVGFWSYARQDDAHSDGQLSQLRALVGKALALRYGEELTLWQDIAAIPFGADWAATIERTIGQVTFFIPIVTPRYLKSENCQSEFRAFRERMRELTRDDLIFPIYYVDVETLSVADTVFGDDLVALRRQQWADFRPLTFDDPKSSKVRQWCDHFAAGVLDAMRRAAPPQARSAAPQRAPAQPAAAKAEKIAAPSVRETPVAPPIPVAAAEAAAPPASYSHGEPQAGKERTAPPPADEHTVPSPPHFTTEASMTLGVDDNAALAPMGAAGAAPRGIALETDPKRIALRFLAFAWFYVLLLATIARDVNAGGLVVYLGPPLVLSLLRMNLRYGTAISLIAMALAQQALGQALAGWSPGETRTTEAVTLAVMFAVYLALSGVLLGAYAFGHRLARSANGATPAL